MTNGTCVCTPTGSKMVGNTCTCPPHASISASTCTCVTGASLSGTSCICDADYSSGWIQDGNAWCSNVKMCCTKCMAKTGDNWGCSDGDYHECSDSGTTVLA
ncbi:Hypothetical_protein [Hexamita inflata]|uniref:Hypothetical_protein n=1 Tax=Hexamita inflata TaxID=28002 RepID=A0AA86P419_9EUKA|nr:Hypothetical protein HINF_LOCUS19497 [Hexamita inflata]